jgi:hypothetical protein
MKSYAVHLSDEEQEKWRQVLSALKDKDFQAHAKYCLQQDWMRLGQCNMSKLCQ